MAVRAGFEPAEACFIFSGFQDQRFKPGSAISPIFQRTLAESEGVEPSSPFSGFGFRNRDAARLRSNSPIFTEADGFEPPSPFGQ